MNQPNAQTIETVAENNDWDFRPAYSGRGMYGNTCVGVVGENAVEIIETVASETGARGAKTDNMGLDMIVYWPHIQG